MNRRTGVLALASTTLAVWLVATSACSSGGGSDDPAEVEGTDVPSDEGLDTGATVPPGTTALEPEATPAASPFDPAASDGPTGTLETAPGTDGDGDLPPDDTSATDDGPELQRPIGDGSGTGAIAGLWDYSRMTDTGTDVVLVAIDDAGGVTEYDDQNDAVGSGAACYVVLRSSIASRGNDRYDIQDSSTLPGATSIDDVLITTDDTTITFRYLGTTSDPQFGESQAGVEETYPAATGTSVDDLAVCEG